MFCRVTSVGRSIEIMQQQMALCALAVQAGALHCQHRDVPLLQGGRLLQRCILRLHTVTASLNCSYDVRTCQQACSM